MPNKYLKLSGPIFASDVDETLVFLGYHTDPNAIKMRDGFNGSPGDYRVPNLAAINYLKEMKDKGYSVVVWSRGGADWAEAVIKALKIEDYVDVVMDKIAIHMDDVKSPYDKLGMWCYMQLDGKLLSGKDKSPTDY